ncbi:MAG: phosphoenolpyruvate carboxykinase (ATP) [Ignavibacteriae bacterium]|nr:phosphoenolpyruvate carboxykinase (ATP) [Ignavibacteriota bacterium]MCB9220503.1 phosphoenolpyruvate carboxykinase (ATP) [Ignavibacteria bacterium]
MSKDKKYSPSIDQADELKCKYGLENHGLFNLGNVYWNLPAASLYEEAIHRGEGLIAEGGPLAVTTGKHTARSANDKYIVREDTSEGHVWWDNNTEMSPENFNSILNKVRSYLQGKDVFVMDAFVGADPDYRIPIRIITENAWQNLFVQNMFINLASKEEFKNHVPGFTLIAVPGFKCNPEVDFTKSETAIALNFKDRIAIVAGTNYAGETKKTFFTVMNYYKPLENVMSMHCSANVGKDGDAALFFGLSGTGKTTLSADPNRSLIGDDEHGWSKNGIFNYEGGCYAKVIRLSEESEPEIYETTRRFGTVLENVVVDPVTRKVDLDNDSLTENTRASYPLEMIPNALSEKRTSAHPKNVIFLTCDATGVLPPIARLNSDQAQYHFISGYTSKIAGTEKGIGKEPKLAFSACFGAPFLVHHPFYYANLLKEKMEQHGSNCWLVNTGWVGGKYGVGSRISIKHTRNVLNAALNGDLDNVEFRVDPIFGFEIPETCPNVPKEVLNPIKSWNDENEYMTSYKGLAQKYIENFAKFEDGVTNSVIEAGPKV